MTLDVVRMALLGGADHTLVVYTAEPGTPDEEALRFLAGWAGQASKR